MASVDGSTLKSCLRAAREAISKREFKDAIREARAALKHDKRSYDALLYIGKAAFSLEEYAQADVAYRKAIEVNAAGLPAWQGLAELHGSTGDHEKLAEACAHLVEGWAAAGQADKVSHFRRKLAQALLDQGKRDEARRLWREVLTAAKQGTEERTEALCALAELEIVEHAEWVEREVQQRSSRQKKLAKLAAKSGLAAEVGPVDLEAIKRQVEADSAPGLDKILEVIVGETASTAQYAKYHVLNLQRALARLLQAPPGSFAELENLVLARSLRMIAAGTSLAEPFLVALALCQEDAVMDLPAWKEFDPNQTREQLARRLGLMFVHAFPNHGLGWIATSANLYAIQQSSPSPDLDAVKAHCQLGLRLDPDSPHGWHVLGTVQLVEASASGALQCVQRGLEAVANLRERYGLRLRRAELQLRLLESAALVSAGRAGDAAEQLQLVEDECEVQLEGADRDEVRLAAIEGQARAAMRAAAEGAQFDLARLALERLLAVQPDNAWAYAQLGDIALRGDDAGPGLEEARRNFERAVELKPEDASFHFSLGQIYWRLGGPLKEDRQYAHAHFLEAARLQPGLAGAFTFLGRYYREVQADDLRARRCFQKAVQLDPDDQHAGTALADMMAASGQRRAEVAMCREACQRSPRAYWAWRRVGFLEARTGRWQEALVNLQHALRGDAKDGPAWEALALAYQRLGKFTAALKAYGQAEKLATAEGRVPVFTLLQAASIQLSLANFRKASDKYVAVLRRAPTHAAALAGLASALLGQARHFQQQGAAQAAADLLVDASRAAQRGVTLHGNSRPLWKLLGDIGLELGLVAPPQEGHVSEDGTPSAGMAHEFLGRLEAARRVRLSALQKSARAYRHTIHLNPGDASGWADLGTCLNHRADFAHPASEGKLRPLHWGWGTAKLGAASAVGAPLADQGLLLRTLAERLVLGGLALDPTAGGVWATLGAVAQERALQQHALIRALHINPKLSAAWINLGQLYLAEGDFALARATFDQARSCDPVLAVPWASMACMEAAEARDAKQREEARSTARHAVQMGPTATGQLGYATLAAGLGQLGSPEVYIALRQATLQLPAVAAVHNLLGLACEARGLLPQAVASLENARAVGAAQGAGKEEEEGVAFNLARVLARAGRHAEAVQEYEKLQNAGAMLQESSAPAWRQYGVSLWRTGRTDAATAAVLQALQLAPPPLPDESPPKAHTAALCALAWIQYQAAGPAQALQTLRESVPECWQDTQVGMTALALATLARDNTMIAFAISKCPALFEHGSAPRSNQLLSLAHRLQKNPSRALLHLRTALHSSPDSLRLRAALSEALRLDRRPEQARQVVQGATRPAAGGWGNSDSVEELGACVQEAAEGLFALGWAAERSEQNEQLFRDLQRWVKLDPAAPGGRAVLALAAALRAQGGEGPQSGRWEAVHRLCGTALEAERRTTESNREGADGETRVALLRTLDAEALWRSRVRAEREKGRQQARLLLEGARGQEEEGRARLHLARNRRTAGVELAGAVESGGSVQEHLAHAASQGASGRYGDALQTLEAAEHVAVLSGPEQRCWATAVRVARADVLLKSGDAESAAAVATDAVEEEPDNPLLLLLQGALLSLAAEGGSGAEAAAAARRALSRAVHLFKGGGRGSPWAHYLLGQAELAAGGGKKGRDKWEAATLTACRQWPHEAPPAELLFQLAELAAASERVGGAGVCQYAGAGPLLAAEQWRRRAVHAHPGFSAYWASLRH
ncbi:superkiller protein 3 [Klebsormidium nitens]|uniref:Superkiller protein 3 n=1 Tax=Klebsormidium nitens TaxID=105231 RepID=A0A1Y1I850_KLENI|nr:superkiller protein 3 [Klebsormidium nitens]|eukprot:GAQ84866.1 superkiller protein 3 [Klebsormidium nitens]